jgi:DNA-binding response OmpR family regulator
MDANRSQINDSAAPRRSRKSQNRADLRLPVGIRPVFFNLFGVALGVCRLEGGACREQGMQVLYVEDDKLMAKNVELILQREGHFCHTADRGERAVELAKRNTYDIIVLDIMLPDFDGYEVIQRLRASGIDTPYLIQSGLVDRDTQPDGLGFGTDEFLIKPFDKAELFESMDRVVTRSKQRSAAKPTGSPADPTKSRHHGPDKRRHRRFATIKAAKVIHKKTQTDCIILNISHGGAAIRLPKNKLDCPENFALKLQSEPLHYCQICWRFRDKIGVKFIGR